MSAEILVVEDSPTQAQRLLFALEGGGYQVRLAANGKEGLAAARERKPALIISDVMMPEMSGYEMCHALKQDPALEEVPVILLTTLSDPEDVIHGLEAQADYYITKPFELDALLARVEHVLSTPMPRAGEAMAFEAVLAGRQRSIVSRPHQVLTLLLATYESAVEQNRQLRETQEELRMLNEGLEDRVHQRTAELAAKHEEVRTMTQQLWQTAKLATVGELAASIAHELNNPLATVSLRVESLLEHFREEETTRHVLEIIEHEVERMGNLVANLLQFSRRAAPQISTFDVREELDNTLELIYYHLRKRSIAVTRDFAEQVPMIQADRQQMRQLFLNLFTNASDAMAQGGTLTVSVKCRVTSDESTDSQPSLDTRHRPPRGARSLVTITVADTGAGIAPQDLAQVTEPFFTTKEEGKGTGLGLAICKRIVEEHRGTLTIASEVGADGLRPTGTQITITLPSRNGTNGQALRDSSEER